MYESLNPISQWATKNARKSQKRQMTGKTKEMPALANPRHERFAQLRRRPDERRAQSLLPRPRMHRAGYEAKDAGKRGGSAEAAASRLLRKVKPILDRVRELQAEANKRNESKIDLSRERVGRSSALGIAKFFHAVPNENDNAFSFKSATSMHDIGRKLLMTVGMENPDVASIALAVEANDTFIERLEEIAAQAQRTIESA